SPGTRPRPWQGVSWRSTVARATPPTAGSTPPSTSPPRAAAASLALGPAGSNRRPRSACPSRPGSPRGARRSCAGWAFTGAWGGRSGGQPPPEGGQPGAPSPCQSDGRYQIHDLVENAPDYGRGLEGHGAGGGRTEKPAGRMLGHESGPW